MLTRQTRIYIRKAILVGLWSCALYVALAALGWLQPQISIFWVERISLSYLLLGLIFFFINDRRMVMVCFACCALLAFLVHEKATGMPRTVKEIDSFIPPRIEKTHE